MAGDEDSVAGVAFLTAASDLEIGDLYAVEILDDDARASASVDDSSAPAI